MSREPTVVSRTPEIAATEDFAELHDRLKLLCEQIDVLQSKADLIKLRLALEIGDSAGIAGLISYQTSEPSLRLSNSAELAQILEAERPDLYTRFWRETTMRPLRVL